ncbi:1-acyl-sn-glycerol-3-phosphate acyltransferase [Allosaccharopolyspora coralli]|uniref:1-acyl-sn-glycerol-3-phosphate acyltransferase n=1 Tax=Allosaccharopolyspora coralli TaxID=2665642 RepID=A0A5Q3QD62_9PSEU|nr:lysophospholipid acyltransferase family protein [Allosaccharopolyspora coralli]QGK71124.1 1-acyl-sn-glycerol-3-phosphate acyltransferase [Allosaccharopolyspora coralli]
MPTSPCGPTCLPRRGHHDRVGPARVALRFTRAFVVFLVGAALVAVLPFVPHDRRRVLFGRWFGLVLNAFGVEVVLRDAQRLDVTGPVLVACNHVSWLDVIALQSVRPMRLLAKAEVRDWPVVGGIAARAGTLFIEREGLRSLPAAVNRVAEALRGGSMIGVYPEGTTWCGRASGRHRPAVFQAAVEADALVQPVALRYRVAGRPSTAAAFVGDATLLSSLVSVARTRGLVLELSALPPWDARTVSDRRELARRVEVAIRSETEPALLRTEHLVAA